MNDQVHLHVALIHTMFQDYLEQGLCHCSNDRVGQWIIQWPVNGYLGVFSELQGQCP